MSGHCSGSTNMNTDVRTALRALIITAIAIAAVLLFPGARAAHAAVAVAPAPIWHADTYQARIFADKLPTYKGWAHVQIYHWGLRPDSPPVPTAWRWTRTGWVKTSLPVGTQVYHYPFASGWSWVWTRTAGWMAIRSELVYIRTETRACGDKVDYVSHASTCEWLAID